MVDITIVNGVYKPTYNYGAPPCTLKTHGLVLELFILGHQLFRLKGVFILRKEFFG
jgi:hypothetical protein